MVSCEGPLLKRTFDESGLEDSQDQDGERFFGGRKLVHLTQDPDSQISTATFQSLPVELLVDIASYLSSAELLSFRLTNRRIEAALFNDFAAYYFTKKQFMMTAESLQCLVDISLHPKLASVLEHVILSIDKYNYNLSAHFFPGDDENGSRQDRIDKYCQGLYSQTALLHTGHGRDLLVQAFGNLSSLKTVGLRDYNNGRRSRDGPGGAHGAHGAKTVERETGIQLLVSRSQLDLTRKPVYFSAQVFTILLHSLALSGARPESVEVLLREDAGGLPDIAFHIPKSLEPTMVPLLSGITTLLLALDLPLNNGTQVNPFEPSVPTVALQHFLSFTPNLTHLRLNLRLGQGRMQSAAVGFLGWIASTDPNSDSPLLPKLTRLDLGCMYVPGELVQRLVARFGSTLEGVSFWRVTIEDSREQQEALRLNHDLIPNRWAELLAQLTQLAPGLKHILVGLLTQVLGPSCHQHIFLNIDRMPGLARRPLTRGYSHEEIKNLERFKEMLEHELSIPENKREAAPDVDEDDYV